MMLKPEDLKEYKIEKINPTLLLTENRHDIQIRVDFLIDVIKCRKTPNMTSYYHFISDENREAFRDPDIASIDFLELCKNIKDNGIVNPILIGKYPDEYQLIDGAHRLAIALYLNLVSIPVKVIPTTDFIVPDYTVLKREV